ILRKTENRIILFIDEVHSITRGPNNQVERTVLDLLKSDLEYGSITLAGATTTKEYEEFLTGDEAFLRRVTVFHLHEPTTDELSDMVHSLSAHLASRFNVTLSAREAQRIAEFSRKVVARFGYQPYKVMRILDGAATEAQTRLERKDQQ